MFCTKENKLIRRNAAYLVANSFIKLYLVFGFVLRIILMFSTPTTTDFSFIDIVRSLGVGLLSDFGVGTLLTIPIFVLYLGLNEWKYNKMAGYVIEALLALAFVYSLWAKSIFHEYGGGAPLIARIFFGWKLASFSLRFFIPRLRMTWRRVTMYGTWGTYVLLFICVSAGEYFFWQEFGVRYNFIAVDYLVYTHEVLGNIMESYSIVPLVLLSVIATAGIIIWQSRRRRFKLEKLYTPKLLVVHSLLYVVICSVAFGAASLTQGFESSNQYVTQLEQNGAGNFVVAFFNNKLEYNKFYPMMDKNECINTYRRLSGLNSQGYKLLGNANGKPRRCNIVLITVESLSADFLKHYGNTEELTPRLDQLIRKSMVFDSLYANGNRTVRGLEALSLCIPPSAGESIIKQKANRMGDMSVGAVLKEQGYTVQFLYGGDSYFDNMGDFFSHNGYEVIDRASIDKNDVTFANIWGVCDEDMFNKSLKVFDANAKKAKPFFAQIMTTSNHRPYTYPEGRIKVEGNPHTRSAAVRYTDYAIGNFIEQASRKPWFNNTIFVIIADHCASSAGKTTLPTDRYHIPCIIYSPKHIAPQAVKTVCSQIDVMPTLLALLNIPCKVSFTGQNIFSSAYRPRAFMATYQNLGYLENNCLTILSPVRKIEQLSVRYDKDGTAIEIPLQQQRNDFIQKAEAYYQFTNIYLSR